LLKYYYLHPSTVSTIGISYGDDVPTKVSLPFKDGIEKNISVFIPEDKENIKKEYEELLSAVASQPKL